MIATPAEVHDYWFGPTPWSHAKMWFEAGRSLDSIVRERFAPTIEAALNGELDSWCNTPQGHVALTVVLDQFTRHVYRDDPRFVAGDAAAQRLALQAFDHGLDARLRTDEILFLLTPLEHAEDMDIQDRGRREVERLAALHPDDLGGMVQYLQEHRDIIERFGRFPDRNRILGRPSTPEEEAYLEETHLPWFERQDLD